MSVWIVYDESDEGSIGRYTFAAFSSLKLAKIKVKELIKKEENQNFIKTVSNDIIAYLSEGWGWGYIIRKLEIDE